jgi:hypothetical protein
LVGVKLEGDETELKEVKIELTRELLQVGNLKNAGTIDDEVGRPKDPPELLYYSNTTQAKPFATPSKFSRSDSDAVSTVKK